MTEPRMTHADAVELAGLYVLGALEGAEEAAVREHLASCPESHAEFDAIGGVVPSLVEMADLELVEPPAALGDRIMAAAAADLAARTRADAVTAERTRADAVTAGQAAPVMAPAASTPAAPIAFPDAAEREARAERTRAERTRTSRFDWALRIAAVIAIVAVGGWGLNLQRQLDAAQRFNAGVATVIDAAAQPGAKAIVLAAAEGSKATGIGAVRPDGAVVLAMRDLPATTGSQVYETWVIVGEEAPLAVGGFTVAPDGTASFTTRPATTPAGATIALTLEPNAGNKAPMGKVVSVGTALDQPSS